MTCSDKITLISAIASFFLAAVSIAVAIGTLCQNSRMIENATRPYLSLYCESTSIGTVQTYLILRNFGQSNALVSDFTSTVDLSRATILDGGPVPFSHIVGLSISPGQSLRYPVSYGKLISLDPNPSFVIRYSSGKKRYVEKTTINLRAHADYLFVHPSENISELKAISQSLQELVTREL